ncbi:MAG TPA: M48 family metallopeptidase [Allocoleopsis sp.]
MYNILNVKTLTRNTYRRLFYFGLSICVAFSMCLFLPQPTLGISLFDIIQQGSQIIQLSNISEQQEIQLGQQINQEILSEMKILNSPLINAYVNQIGQRLARNSDRPNLPFIFQVVDNDAINAFATAGGFVYIHTGLLKTAANEAELASVIGHEIGHITGRHVLKQMRQMAIAKGITSLVGADKNQLVGIGVELGFRRPRSRNDELDADKRGLKNMKTAGYAQSAMISFMQKLMSGSSSSQPSILSTHPATKDRIAALQKNIDPQYLNVKDGLNSNSYKLQIRSLL